MHKIPGLLPSTCTVSAPIWSTDEFGELYAIRPTSALDVNDSNTPKSVITHKTTVAGRTESVIAPSHNAVGGSAKASGGVAKKAVPPKAGAASAGGKLHLSALGTLLAKHCPRTATNGAAA